MPKQTLPLVWPTPSSPQSKASAEENTHWPGSQRDQPLSLKARECGLRPPQGTDVVLSSNVANTRVRPKPHEGECDSDGGQLPPQGQLDEKSETETPRADPLGPRVSAPSKPWGTI